MENANRKLQLNKKIAINIPLKYALGQYWTFNLGRVEIRLARNT